MKRALRGGIQHGGKRAVAILLTAASICGASAAEFNLSAPGSQQVNVTGVVGGTAIFADNWTQPTGTGVFDPFLSLDANGQTSTGNNNIEHAYNSDAKGAQHPDLYLDQHRSEWNTLLRVGDLAQINMGGLLYYGFILDANEPGGSRSRISIDNIRIYTSSSDNTASVQNNAGNLDALGDLRWAMNDPLTGTPTDLNGFNVDQWINLDASQENIAHSNSNGGSGQSDMIVYIPVTAFGNALATDYLWFYNLNGVHYGADGEAGATSGFEEWRAVTGASQVPEGGSTVVMLGLALMGFAGIRRQLRK